MWLSDGWSDCEARPRRHSFVMQEHLPEQHILGLCPSLKETVPSMAHSKSSSLHVYCFQDSSVEGSLRLYPFFLEVPSY